MSDQPPKKIPKTSIPRQKMDQQPAQERIKNFQEVPHGFTAEQARLEASRCLQCKDPKCVAGCPVRVPIPEFLDLIAKGKFEEAAHKVKEQNVLPAVCGRVCPQEDQCESECILGKRFLPVSIGYLERFVADHERTSGTQNSTSPVKPNGKKVAVVGSGPAGLTVAGDLAKLGYDVVVFEALHEAGGVLTYGIPEFRLPKDIVKAEVDALRDLGVAFEMNTLIGRTITIDELFSERGFNAVFIGTGAGTPQFIGIPGENLNGVYSSNEYLTRANLMKAYRFPEYDTPIIKGKIVATIGGGNVAMDSARTALRLGAEKSMILYRRSRAELPARTDEIEHAEEEGIEFHYLTKPVEILGSSDGGVLGLRCQKMELGEPDASSRRTPIPIAGSEYDLKADVVIIAIGTFPNPMIAATTPGIKTEKWGGLIIDAETGRTSLPHVYAGGDITDGSSTVISAMGAGRRAAQAIHKELGG